MPPDLGNIITLDFETAWATDYSLTKTSTSEYVRSPRFKVHMVGIRRGLEPAVWYPEEDLTRVLGAINWAETYLLCHNTAFDGFILSHHYGIIPKGYLDTLSMSRALFGASYAHSLEALGQRLGLGGKREGLAETKGLWDLPPEVENVLGDYCCRDVDLTFECYQRLATHMPPAELEVIDITMRMFCDPVLEIDHEMIELAMSLERAKKFSAMAVTSMSKKDLGSNEIFAAALTRLGAIPPMKVSPKTKKLTYAFAKTDAGFRALRSHANPDIRELAEARVTVKSSINETRAERLKTAGSNGHKVPVLLNYCGAHTTRFSGGNKMNMQNLTRPEYDDNGDVVENTGLLRRSLLAPPGHQLVVADSAQIEARITAWLAGQWDLVEQFRNKVDVYRMFAAELYGKRPEDVTKLERFIGKICVLGLGYGMGGAKLQITLEQGTMGPPVIMALEKCYDAVDFYRAKNHRIKMAWREMDYLLAHMVKPPKPGKDPVILDHGPLKVGYGFIQLPNGLFLHYSDLKYDPMTQEYTYRSRSGRSKIYGALLLENIVQALSRTAIVDNMVQLHREGIHLVTMTHDEIVAVARDEDADRVLARMIEVMCIPPAWAPDLPLAAEGGYARNYSK
jgi:DNA polymerase